MNWIAEHQIVAAGDQWGSDPKVIAEQEEYDKRRRLVDKLKASGKMLV